MSERLKVGTKRVKIKFPLTKKEATSFWAAQSYDCKKVGLKKRKKFFIAVVSKMGRKRMINVPVKQDGFKVGAKVMVEENE